MAKPKRVIKSAPSGTFQEKLKEAKSRPYKGTKGGVPARVEKVRATQRQYSGPPHRMKGPQKSVNTFRPVPLRDKPIGIEGPKSAAQAAARFAGSYALKGAALTASFALSPSTFSYKTGGKAEAPAPQKGEKLMKGGRQPGYKYAGDGAMSNKDVQKQYTWLGNPTQRPISKPRDKAKVPARGESRGGMKSTLESYRQSKVGGTGNPKTVNPYKASVSMASGGVNKPETKAQAPKPKDKAFTLGTGAQTPKKKASVSAKTPALRSNWVGAAPTEMQKRGGQRIKRPNLLSLLRKK